VSQETPTPGAGPEQGRQRVRALNQVLLDIRPAAPLPTELLLWAAGLAQRGGQARGLARDELSADRLDAVQEAGLPISIAGPLRWGSEVCEDAGCERPHEVDGRLLLPGVERLRHCTAVELKPLRRHVQRHLGVRLQAAPGIVCFLWQRQVALVSVATQRLAGFLHGPGAGQRQSLAWRPGQALVLRLGESEGAT
jgi:hypothetical protein